MGVRLRPAGQGYTTSDVTLNVTPTGTTSDTGLTSADQAYLLGLLQNTPPGGNESAPGAADMSFTPEQAGISTGLTAQQQSSLFSGIGSILRTTGTDVASAILSGDRVQQANLDSQVLLRIAQLQTEEQTAAAHGNTLAAQRAGSNVAILQALHSRLNAQDASTARLINYGLGGAAVLVAAGAGWWFFTRKPKKKRSSRTRKNPSGSCGCPHSRGR